MKVEKFRIVDFTKMSFWTRLLLLYTLFLVLSPALYSDHTAGHVDSRYETTVIGLQSNISEDSTVLATAANQSTVDNDRVNIVSARKTVLNKLASSVTFSITDSESGKISTYQFRKSLGSGGAGTVIEASDVDDPKIIKVFKVYFEETGSEVIDHIRHTHAAYSRKLDEAIAAGDSDTESVFTPIDLQGTIQFDNMQFYAISFPKLETSLDYLGKNLLALLGDPNHNPKESIEEAWSLFNRIFTIQSSMYKLDVVHCDVKGANLMGSSLRDLRLIDPDFYKFGDDQVGLKKSGSGVFVASLLFTPPESAPSLARQKGQYTQLSDSFALAMSFFSWIIGEKEFSAFRSRVMEQNKTALSLLVKEMHDKAWFETKIAAEINSMLKVLYTSLSSNPLVEERAKLQLAMMFEWISVHMIFNPAERVIMINESPLLKDLVKFNKDGRIAKINPNSIENALQRLQRTQFYTPLFLKSTEDYKSILQVTACAA